MTSASPPDKAPVCSVCIANYNGLKLIDACLQSVLQQQFSGTIEIIVHDDASTDGSADYIRTHYPQVQLIASNDNVGFCISNNRMADIARGEYLLLLNNDAELFDDAIATLYAHAQNLQQPAILGLPQYDAATGKLIDIGSSFDLFLNPVPNLNPEKQEAGMIIGACLWMPRTLWMEIGGFPDWFGSLAEDMYVCCVARLYAYPVLALGTSGFRHWVGQSLGGGKVLENKLSTKLTRRVVSERNKTYVMIMTSPAPLIYLLLPLHLCMLLLEGLVLAALKQRWTLFSQIYWGCLKSQWQEKKRLAAWRRQIQSKRAVSQSDYLKVFSLVPYKLRMLFRHGLPEVK
ncbi:glycosyltransferase family 2 protein [Undibacterium sp. Di26W]|uniref:glycosyltransferase family 2 protein n=1 Tax=Undibacterium sp. Di26W TaxID=3413035 RepID=UPI003BF2F2C1